MAVRIERKKLILIMWIYLPVDSKISQKSRKSIEEIKGMSQKKKKMGFDPGSQR